MSNSARNDTEALIDGRVTDARRIVDPCPTTEKHRDQRHFIGFTS